MFWQTEWKYLLVIVVGFLVCFYLPVGNDRFDQALLEALHLVQWYAQQHVLMCLIPAFFIAGAIGIFVSQSAVMKYLGPGANKVLAYAVAAVSGGILTVCSCTILPLFAGIYRMGAGLGPACTFLYGGPAVNVLAAIMTFRILGLELGIARIAGAVGISILIGLLMSFIFRKEEQEKVAMQTALQTEAPKRTLTQNGLFFTSMIGILVFGNLCCQPPEEVVGRIGAALYTYKQVLTSLCGIALGVMLVLWFGMKWWKVVTVAVPTAVLAYLFPSHVQIPFAAAILGLSFMTSTDKGECGEWFAASWSFAKQIFPLLLFGIFIAGLLLGRVGHEGLIPSEWIAWTLGGNSLRANFFASFGGVFMYFATLTEVPFVQALIGAGMGKGPALSLLLTGPALSLPSVLVIYSVLGLKKMFAFIGLVIVFSTFMGMMFGCFCTPAG